MSGNGAAAGAGVLASGNTMSGDNAKAGGGVAAACDAFVDRMAAGTFGYAIMKGGACACLVVGECSIRSLTSDVIITDKATYECEDTEYCEHSFDFADCIADDSLVKAECSEK